MPRWRETALWWPRRQALIVAEALASNPMHTGGRRLGVHLFLRAWPPRSLRGYRPRHLLLGHGPGIHGSEAAAELEAAFARSRRDLPRVLLGLLGAVQ
jgi:hypothetical protein